MVVEIELVFEGAEAMWSNSTAANPRPSSRPTRGIMLPVPDLPETASSPPDPTAPPGAPAPPDPSNRPLSPALAVGQIRALLKAGESVRAFDVASRAFGQFPGDIELSAHFGLAMRRAGALIEAVTHLRATLARWPAGPELATLRDDVVGALAACHKALWQQHASDAPHHLANAAQLYLDGFKSADAQNRHAGAYYLGINAASLLMAQGDRVQAIAVAAAVINHATAAEHAATARASTARASTDDASTDDVSTDDALWRAASVGEAHLLLGNITQAAAAFTRAARLATESTPPRLGDLGAIRKQARWVVPLSPAHLPAHMPALLPADWIDSVMPRPSVVAFAGHMIDGPNRSTERFPARTQALVAEAIKRWLNEHNAMVGVTALANGADVLFAEAMLARGGRVEVLLPLEEAEFIRVSVAPGGPSWVARMQRVLAQATSVQVLGDKHAEDSGAPFHMVALLIDGQARLLAHELDLAPLTLTVWDGKPGDGLGGTASFVVHALAQGRSVHSIDPLTGSPRHVLPDQHAVIETHDWLTLGGGPGAKAGAGDMMKHAIVSVLFADAKGFSGLSETQIPAFVREFLGAVKVGIDAAGQPVIAVNTWGDGLFVVASTPAALAAIALSILDAVTKIDWPSRGLPAALALRIGLHSGPAFVCVDPVTGRPSAMGVAVSRAARIEPITPPGRVFASRAFACLAAATGADDLAFEYVGPRTLPKNAGELPLYVMRRA